jgi:hypothetical protein
LAFFLQSNDKEFYLKKTGNLSAFLPFLDSVSKLFSTFPPPPLSRPPHGGSKQNDLLVHPSGSLNFYAEIRGSFASPNFDLLQITERVGLIREQ